MAFSIKTWVDRLSEFPNRRKLDSTGITDTYDVTRAEGTVSTEGDKFNAATMNDLEQRINSEFSLHEADSVAHTTQAQKNTIASAVQSATIGGTAVPKSGTVLQLPAYPTSLPANGGSAATLGGKSEGQLNVSYAASAGSAPANGGTAADTTSINSALILVSGGTSPSSTLVAGKLWGGY
jgi:hypothetical protein